MKIIIRYIRKYFYDADKWLLVFTSLYTALLIFLNYYLRLDDQISEIPAFEIRFLLRYLIYAMAFWVPYIVLSQTQQIKLFSKPIFLFLLIIAPAVFSVKAGIYMRFFNTGKDFIDVYWNQVLHWPILLLFIVLVVGICWKLFDNDQPLYGTTTKNINWKPYILMLIFMLPLIAAAATQPDFLRVYPKLQSFINNSTDQPGLVKKILFELSYGSDFIGIEFFFRGFIVLAFIKWAGMHAIIPMACFYCSIHFGKPLGECISSYFGGMLLGIVVLNTRSIWGGLMVHLGIAWLMEIAGFIGNNY